MKKVKIMLLSIPILAVVGGALAFKANFNEAFCYTYPVQTLGGALTCPEVVQSCDEIQLTTQPNNPTLILCINHQVEVDCSFQDDCTIYTTVQVNY